MQLLLKRIRKLIKPSVDWGPGLPNKREVAREKKNYDGKFNGMKRDVEGSNVTLVTNASQSAIINGGNNA